VELPRQPQEDLHPLALHPQGGPNEVRLQTESLHTVADLGSLVVDAAVLEHDLPLIRRGATAVVTVSAEAGRRFLGTVMAVLPLVDSTTRAGRALVRTGDGALRPGGYADMELEATRLRDRVIVPAAAVIERDGRPLVFRYRRGRAEWVYVTPGRSNGRETEIRPDSASGRSAVAPGDTVLVEGHLTLTHDAPARLSTAVPTTRARSEP
jgi:multidrug efflux pump subunit AcrA (membrane-fusion protein)